MMNVFRAVIFACVMGMVHGAEVTFQVDMTGITVHESGVWLAGGDMGQLGTQLTQVGNSDIYQTTLALSAYRAYKFKFRNGYNPQQWWDYFETIQQVNNELCVIGDYSDRDIYPTADMTYLAAYGNCPSSLPSVSFEVDMSGITVHETGLYLAGGHAGNVGIQLEQEGTTSIYKTTIKASYIEFKFRNRNTTGTNDWGGFEEIFHGQEDKLCVAGQWSDRILHTTTDVTFKTAYGKCPTSTTYTNVIFQLDMTGQTYNSSQVSVVGGNFQREGRVMQYDGDDLFSLTIQIFQYLHGADQYYRFARSASESYNDGSVETVPDGCRFGGNRKFNVETQALTLGRVKYGFCVSCQAGEELSNSECVDCDAGKYSNDGQTCTVCPNGYYAAQTGSSQCTACSAGTYTDAQTGYSQCTDCAAGKYSSQTDTSGCNSCGYGTYSTVGASECTDCPLGKYSTEWAATSESACKYCDAGKYSSDYGSIYCKSCSYGTYSTEGASECTDCPLGKYSTESAATSASACKNCDAGKYGDELGASGVHKCKQCDAGKYSSEVGAISESVCKNCDAGKYSGSRAATSESACNICSAGKYSAQGASQCTNCPLGKYSSAVGATSVSACNDCTAGRYGTQTGASSFGYCKQCDAGKYSSEVGAISESVCKNCPTGSQTLEVGATNISSCFCPVGSYVSTNGGCTLCGKGTYSDENGMSQCKNCDAGRFSSDVGAISVSACKNCDAGMYSSEVGATSIDVCNQCPYGTYSDEEGTSECKICTAGKYSSDVGATSAATCKNCAAGKYSSDDGAISASACTDCAAGTYSDDDGASLCKNCAADKTSFVGSTQCYTASEMCTALGACPEACPAGKVSFAGSPQCYTASEMFNELGKDVSRQDIIDLYNSRNFSTCSS